MVPALERFNTTILDLTDTDDVDDTAALVPFISTTPPLFMLDCKQHGRRGIRSSVHRDMLCSKALIGFSNGQFAL